MKHILIIMFFLALRLNLGAQWEQTSGPLAAAIQCYTSASSYLFCGTYGAGIYRSDDNGLSWQSASNGLLSAYVSDMAYNNGHLIAATSNGVYVSIDNGNSWEQKNSGLSATGISKVICNESAIYIAVQNSVYKSINWGDNWTLTNYSASPVASITGLVLKGNFIFCSSSIDGIKKSSDGGNSWSNVNSGLPATSITGLGTDGSSLFICITNEEVYTSADNGNTWTYAGTGLLSGTAIYSFQFTGNTILAGGNNGIAISNNYGQSWIQATDPLNRAVQATYKSGNRFFASNYEHTVFYNYRGGNYFSDDLGLNWTRSNEGIINSNVIELKVNEDLIIAGTEGGTFISQNQGDTWDEVSYETNTFRRDAAQAIEIKDSIILIGTVENKVYRSTDSGNSWMPFGIGMSGDNVSSIKIYGNKVFASTQNGIFKTTLNGTSWNNVPTGFSGLTYNSISYQGNNLLVGTNSGLLLSSDSGLTWNDSSAELSDLQIYTLKSSVNKVYASTSGGIFFSSDSGATWQNCSPQITRKFAVKGERVYTKNKYSIDGGITWSSLPAYNAPFTLAPFEPPIEVDDGNLYIGLLHLGVWKLATSSLTGFHESNEPFSVNVFPNPATNNLTISSNTLMEKICLVSYLGETAFSIQIKSNQAVLDLSPFRNGIYYVIIYTGKSSVTRKINVNH